MNKKMYITLTSAAGLIVLVSTSALYVLTAWGSADRTVAAASLLFVLLAEIIFFAALVLLEAAGGKLANAAFVWSGQTILTGVYWIFTIIMAVINGYYYSDTTKFVMHEMSAAAVFILALIALYMSAMKINAVDRHSSESAQYMRDIERRLIALCLSCGDHNIKKELEYICDMARYCDKTAEYGTDKRIGDATAKLEDEWLKEEGDRDCGSMRAAAAELKTLFEQRLNETAGKSRGRF